MGAHTQAGQYLGRTWSLWLACGAFLLAPFWFNPLGFSWPHVADDFVAWRRWISYGTRGGSATDSWDVRHKEETAPLRRLSNRSKCVVSLKAVLYVVLAKGLFDFSGKAATRRLIAFSYALLVLASLQVCAYVVDAWRIAYTMRATASCRWSSGSVASVSLSMRSAPTRPRSNSPSPCTTSPRPSVCWERSGAARAPPSMVVEDIRSLLRSYHHSPDT